MAEKILTLNLGSSSLKFALFDRETMHREMGETIEGVDTPALQAIEQKVAEHGGAISAIAHRVVHGGWLYQDHARITLEMLEKLKGLEALAPNHLPLEIRFMAASLEHFVDIPQIACFDTVFHRDLPVAARTLALPRRLQQAGVRRYGFHGLSYTYLMRTLPEYIGERANGRIILAHLGSGASLAAVKKGVAIDTTMGMTPLGGLVMATRCGDIDPGVPLFLAKTQGLSQEGFEHMAYAESGLLGLSETSGDVRDLLKSEAHDSRAAEALSIFCYQTRKWIAAMAAALEGVDVIVFSGGIGAHSVQIRQRICEDLEWLGLTLDPQANAGGEPCISAPLSKVMAFAIPTDEEIVMAQIASHLLFRVRTRLSG